MKKWILGVAVAIVAFSATEARAEYWLFRKSTHGNSFSNHKQSHLFSTHGGQTLPVFMAAPWYLYWPYDAHFLTPAPVGGAFYAPPIQGNFPVQPYFPGPQGPAPQWMPPVGGTSQTIQPPIQSSPVGQR